MGVTDISYVLADLIPAFCLHFWDVHCLQCADGEQFYNVPTNGIVIVSQVLAIAIQQPDIYMSIFYRLKSLMSGVLKTLLYA